MNFIMIQQSKGITHILTDTDLQRHSMLYATCSVSRVCQHTYRCDWYVPFVQVHVPYNMSIVDEEAEFEDSHTAHTAQFFFDSTLYDQVATTYPYTRDTTIPRVTNSEDLVFKADPSAVLDITWVGSSLEDGLVATMTTHIDPSSTPAAGV